jgi:diguanylate cyclase (GGDEF)-like protein/PAS domain S-box-containing protein
LPEFDTSKDPFSSATRGDNFHEQLINSLYDGIYFVSVDRIIQYWNKGAEALTGYTAQEAVGRACFDDFLNHQDESGCRLCLGQCPLEGTLTDGVRRESEISLRHKDGHRIPVSVRIGPIFDDEGKLIGAVEIFTDVTAKKRIERRVSKLERMAFRDPLTKIPNRRYTELKVSQALQESREFSRNIGVLLIDLDRFKQLNDTYGHEAGDRALRAISHVLMQTLRPGDIVGRWGGDEFLAIVPDVTLEELIALAERCGHSIAAAGLEPDSLRCALTASIGGTLVNASDTELSVVSRADELMYKSKSLGRNRVVVA